MINRKEEIKKKGFNMFPESDDQDAPNSYQSIDFSKIQVGVKTLSDAVLDLGSYHKVNPRYGDKQYVLEAIRDNNYDAMRDISNFYYKTSGIYFRLCRYIAYIYNYDWMVTPYVEQDNMKQDKILSQFTQVLKYCDNFEIKKFFGEVALKVIRNGCYYGYIIRDDSSKMTVQELPPKYCRSRFKVGNRPVVEFNMRFFDDSFPDPEQKDRMLTLFPAEFRTGYNLYTQGKLPGDFPGDSAGWYLLDTESVVKFNLNDEDFPVFISVIPSIIDLDDAEGLYKKKMEQQLLKIIIQKMPIDKNGDLVFDIDEAQQLHNNAVQMLGKAIGVDVLTTFADVDVADMSDPASNTTSTNELEAMEDLVYQTSGTAENLFNTSGNLSLEKSILNDEALMYNLLLQFESFLNNDLLKPFNKKPNKIYFKAQLLTTTIYNYQEMSQKYKELTQLGYSKMLPEIALGQSQSSVLANAYFENNVLDLVNVFIPPLMSSTMNAEVLDRNLGEEKSVGRNEKPEDEKSDKTIANEESMN